MIVDCFDDSRLSTVSPHGIIAYATPERICVYDTQARSINYVSSETKKLRSLKWLKDRGLLAIIYTDCIHILSIYDPRGGLRINMGSKPFGEVSRVEQLDESKILIIFEFGTTFKWCFKTAKGQKLRPIKTTTSGTAFATRPRDPENPNRITGMAYICKDGAEDMLCILCGGMELKRKTLPTTDAQSVSWSSDGNWIAVLDTPIASSGVGAYFYTADGNHYMSYPRAPYQWVNDLGIKELTWSPVRPLRPQPVVALSGYEGQVVLLDSKTFSRAFSPDTVCEHSRIITKMHHLGAIFQETVSASGERSYEQLRVPVNPAVTRAKEPADPKDLGIAEVSFSCDGQWLATRDERFQSTIWIWTCPPGGQPTELVSVLFQHRNVRKIAFHPTVPIDLFFDCGEGIVYHYNLAEPNTPPQALNLDQPGIWTFTWIPHEIADIRAALGNDSAFGIEDMAILASSKTRFCIVFPNKQPEPGQPVLNHVTMQQLLQTGRSGSSRAQPGQAVQSRQAGSPQLQQGQGDDSPSHLEDSLDEILSGRTPAPPAGAGAADGVREELPSITNQQSFTQIISESMDYDDDDEDEGGGGGMTGGGLDDTFREKKKKKEDAGKGKGKGVEVEVRTEEVGRERDPLDDSEIF
ncbi:hypothetical protein KC340_g16299 [Hortaea werneckii]|nr:hypothetical protein KC342_g16615 [Hortaea werneckii]KAI7060197.1 hypothetical protein KC339_g17186 [Hortaea werneckii]KAI7211345.1 hypothetical protein KC365_g14992 [Hortaea werneckii]KAI7294063.1 hypothetical protein KC340_g16299 [Hortaea werneckii]KAI7379262.1 hypothetical protein KC328_g13436 [Hortaea werneckii]